jgi:hypothetical protein
VFPGIPAFGRTELEAACEDFSNIIGVSRDIVLFKGTLDNGAEIAVTSIRKSAKSWSTNSELIFWRKVRELLFPPKPLFAHRFHLLYQF